MSEGTNLFEDTNLYENYPTIPLFQSRLIWVTYWDNYFGTIIKSSRGSIPNFHANVRNLPEGLFKPVGTYN